MLPLCWDGCVRNWPHFHGTRLPLSSAWCCLLISGQIKGTRKSATTLFFGFRFRLSLPSVQKLEDDSWNPKESLSISGIIYIRFRFSLLRPWTLDRPRIFAIFQCHVLGMLRSNLALASKHLIVAGWAQSCIPSLFIHWIKADPRKTWTEMERTTQRDRWHTLYLGSPLRRLDKRHIRYTKSVLLYVGREKRMVRTLK